MEQMNNEQTIYNAALYCRLSKDDEQAGESVSIGTQKIILEKFCKENGFSVQKTLVDLAEIIFRQVIIQKYILYKNPSDILR